MKKIIFASLSVIVLSGAVIANAMRQTDNSVNPVFVEAFKLAHKQDWKNVDKLINKENDDDVKRILTWMRFIDENEKHDFSEISSFFASSEIWPKNATLRKNIEKSISSKESVETIKAWFDKTPPLSYAGVKNYSLALIKLNEAEKAKSLLKKSWLSLDLCAEDEKDFLNNFKKYLDEKDFITKIDKMLWSNDISKAKSLLKHVPNGYQKLFNARIALKERRNGVQKLINAIPKELQNNPGLTFDRTVYRRKINNLDGAISLLQSASVTKGDEQKWYNERNLIYRRLLMNKEYQKAYDLFANHNHESNTLYVHSEWNLAFASYQFLKDYNQALIHLSNMQRKSTSAVSKARVHYYTGLCLEKLGKIPEAKEEFKKGANFNMSFYGQLSSARSESLVRQIAKHNIASGNFILPHETVINKISEHELVKMINLLKKYEQDNLIDVFATRLNFLVNNTDEILALSLIYKDIGNPGLIVGLSRRLRLLGTELGRMSFPVPEYNVPNFVDKNLAYAIMRQESDFNKNVISSANAMGLMQVLPSTAKEISLSIKEKYSKTRLIDDPEYNILIGSNYIEKLIKRFNGSYILAIAAYNAGPTNVKRWIDAFGELGEEEEDILAWIEMIPFDETRNYVQRVLENLYIYRIISSKMTSV